jgi:serine protease AprX
MVLLSSMAVMAATPNGAHTPNAKSAGYSTYIVEFKNSPSIQAENGVNDLINSYDGNIVYRYSVIDGMAVTIPDNKVSAIQALDNVKSVVKSQECKVLLDKAVSQIGADKVWAAGYTGKGVKVAVIDTGVDASHPDLNGDKVVAWVDFVNGKTSPYDDHGHGTHVSSTIAGTGNASDGKYRGVAPDASLMEAKVLSGDGSGSDANIIKGIDWAVQNGAQVISMSLGSTAHDQAIDDAVAGAVSKGVTVVVAAGNSGPDANTISSPGDCPSAITVGASGRNDTIASFSSRGPSYDGSIKPDVTNMGVGLVAAKASGTNPTKGTKYYVAMSGTSMATPMTSGVVALLLQANSSQTPSQVKSVLEKTAVPLGGSVPNNNYGYGRVNATAALNSVLAGRGPAPTPTPIPGPAPKPTPTPFPHPGSYAVSLANTFAKYNGQVGHMSYFHVRPGTTIEQEIMLANTGNSDDSYTISVNGIPAAWYELYGYSGVTMPGDTVDLMALDVTPADNATPGTYHFTVTATSDTDSTISSTISYTLTIAPLRPAYG